MSDLTDYDFMELVVFDRAVEIEGYSYAAENYPPRFERATEEWAALLSEHRSAINEFWDRKDSGDLYDAHRKAARKRQDDACLWGTRFENGNIAHHESETSARWMSTNKSWGTPQLLRRDQPGGEWIEVGEKETGDE